MINISTGTCFGGTGCLTTFFAESQPNWMLQKLLTLCCVISTSHCLPCSRKHCYGNHWGGMENVSSYLQRRKCCKKSVVRQRYFKFKPNFKERTLMECIIFKISTKFLFWRNCDIYVKNCCISAKKWNNIQHQAWFLRVGWGSLPSLLSFRFQNKQIYTSRYHSRGVFTPVAQLSVATYRLLLISLSSLEIRVSAVDQILSCYPKV